MRAAAALGMPTPMPWDVRLMNRATQASLVMAGLALTAVALIGLMRQPWFAFGRIVLEGDLNRSSLATIRANALPRLQGNFFTVDLQDTRRAFEAVPWVRRAEVRRHWPHELRVSLQEHRAVALWEEIDARERLEDRLVGEDGSVFQANPGDVEDENLPQFRGPQGSSARMWSIYRPLQQLLAPLGTMTGGREQASIRLLQLSSKGSWTVELDSGARLELGRGENTELLARAERFVRTLPQALQTYRRPLLYADLRHAEGYALRLAGITTTAAIAAAPPAPAARPTRTRP